jgi:hypothetical protein
MNKLIIALAVVFFGIVGTAHAQTDKGKQAAAPAQADENKATLTFDKNIHDFGDINQGDVVSHSFKFKNTGKSPLILTNVQVTCGCTAPKWPKEPIMPGKTAVIEVSFNSAGKMGKQNKVITVTSNASNATEYLTINSNILAPKN